MNWSAIEPKRSHYDIGGESLFQGFLPELFAVSLDTCLKNEKWQKEQEKRMKTNIF